MSKKNLSVVILAGGKGSRMNSELPKILYKIGGKSMMQHLIDTVTNLNVSRIHVIYGPGGEQLTKTFYNNIVELNWVKQSLPYGSGHAVQQVLPELLDNEYIIVLYGDVPLISCDTLQRLLLTRYNSDIGLVTAKKNNPDGYGRIIRKNGEIIGIIEETEANEEQRKINEISTGILFAKVIDLKRWLSRLTNHNSKNEYYLTDIVTIAWNEGGKIHSVQPVKLSEVEGVNNHLQLALLDRIYQKEKIEELLLAGVMLSDPERFYLRGKLLHEKDVFIDTNVIIEGIVFLGNRVSIGTGCVLKNSVICDDVVIRPYTLIEDAHIDSNSTVGPFSHLRPGSKLGEKSHVGNFVEIKQATIGKESKAGHLSYIGNTIIGNRVNIGAGTITCNYDGANKHHTVIGDDVFVGSGSQLVAPVTIGKGATIGAGTTVTKNVLEDNMIISRVRQFPIPNWKRPEKIVNHMGSNKDIDDIKK